MTDIVQGLDCISLHVHDIRKSREFYTRVLGLKEVRFDEDGAQLVVATPDGVRLTMHVQAPGEVGREAGTITGVIFSVRDAKQAMDEVNRRGGKAYDLWRAPWNTTYVTIADPDGNELLLAQRH